MYREDVGMSHKIFIADTSEHINELCSELSDYGFDVYADGESIVVRNAEYDMDNITDLLDEYGTYYSTASYDDALCVQKCDIIKNLLDEVNIGLVNVGDGYCLFDYDALYNDGAFLLDSEPVKYSSLPEILDNETIKQRINDCVFQLLKQELEQDNYELSSDDFPETAVQWQNKIFSSYDYNVFKQDRPEADVLTRIIANRVNLPLEALIAKDISMEQRSQLLDAINRGPDIKMNKNESDFIKANERA